MTALSREPLPAPRRLRANKHGGRGAHIMDGGTQLLWTEIISGVAIVLVAIIEALSARERKKTKADQKRLEERYKRRQELERLEMDVILAQSELLNIMSIAITGGRTNGNVEVAQVKLTQATDAYQGFIRDEASKAATKE